MFTSIEIPDLEYARSPDQPAALVDSVVETPAGQFVVRTRVANRGGSGGLGPRVVLLHGIGSSWQSWERVIPFCDDDLEIVVFDLPGFGQSPRPENGMGADDAATVINRVLAQLDRRPTVLVGHSLGTLAALHVALQRPPDVVGLVVVSGAVLGLLDLLRHPTRSLFTHPTRLAKSAWPIAASALPLPNAVRRSLSANDRYQAIALGQAVARPELLDDETKVESLQGMHHRNVLRASANALGYDYAETFGALELPVSFINGTDDRLSPPRDVERLARICASESITWLERVGHWPNLEAPDVLASVIGKYVRG